MTLNLMDSTGMTEVAKLPYAQYMHIEYMRDFWNPALADNLVDYSEPDLAQIDALAATWPPHTDVICNIEGGETQGLTNWNVGANQLADGSLDTNVNRYLTLIQRVKQTYTGNVWLWGWGVDQMIGYWNENRPLKEYFDIEDAKQPVYDELYGLMPNLYVRDMRMPRFRDQITLQMYLAHQYGKPVIPSTWHRYGMAYYEQQYMDGFAYAHYMNMVRDLCVKYGSDSIMLWAGSSERGYSTTQKAKRYSEPTYQNPNSLATDFTTDDVPSTDRCIQISGFNGPTYKERAAEWFRTLQDFEWITP